MKSFFLFLCSFGIISYSLTATIITVSNNPNIPAQFTNLQTAIDSASAGDTIYVHPSTTHFGNVTIDKELHLIGDGHFWLKQFGSFVGNIALQSGASNSTFRGLKCNFTTAGLNLVNNIIIDRCHIGNLNEICGSNWIITNSALTGGSTSDPCFEINNNSNIIISNNILYGYGMKFRNSMQNTVLIINNIFQHGNIGSVWNAIISNNIFYFSSPGNCSYCTFNNNITFNTNQDALPYGNNTGGGNFQGVDPQFVDVVGAVPYDVDFHLQSTSPGIGAGTDGTDIGIFGGPYPWPEFENNAIDYTGEPAIPQVRWMNILNAVVGENSELRFNARVEVKK